MLQAFAKALTRMPKLGFASLKTELQGIKKTRSRHSLTYNMWIGSEWSWGVEYRITEGQPGLEDYKDGVGRLLRPGQGTPVVYWFTQGWLPDPETMILFDNITSEEVVMCNVD